MHSDFLVLRKCFPYLKIYGPSAKLAIDQFDLAHSVCFLRGEEEGEESKTSYLNENFLILSYED